MADTSGIISRNGTKIFGMPNAFLDRSCVRPDHATFPGLMVALSAAMDRIDPDLAYHHKRVGMLAGNCTT
jgi:hypothetical protein